jgi:Domain of unknown function (DUF4349)
MRMMRSVGVVLALALVVACQRKQEVQPQAVAGEKGKAGALLAYEHEVDIRLREDAIGPRIAAARAACDTARFGACNVLRIEQSGAGAYARNHLVLRVDPKAVEPMVALASAGGKIGARSSTAEDLTDEVADTGRQRDLIERQQSRLQELQARKDLSAADLVALSREQATLEIGLQEIQRKAANQQHRLDTNLLTLHFSTDREDSRWTRVGDAFSGLPDGLVNGVDESMEMLGQGLPFLILAFPLALLWRWLWRRATRARREGKE